ncbi:hypothetical protein Tco_0294091 [Tanacetum coccineum]
MPQNNIQCLCQLMELAELRDGAYENTRIYKERTKKWHDSRLRDDKDLSKYRAYGESTFFREPLYQFDYTMRRLTMEELLAKIIDAKIDVFKRKITLRVGEEKTIFKSVKPTRSLIKRVYMLGLRERMELDLEARIMGETLVLNRSLDPFFEDYIELNDLNVPLELRRDQVDDLMPTIKEGKVIEEFRARNDARIFEYPSDYDHDKKIRIDCAYNLKNERCYFGEPFLREVRINAKRFEGMITIHNGNEEVTYQMARSHPRFKHHTNEQCNKIPPLLKVSEEDKMNGISHSYQKLKSFYKGVLNLGLEYVRDAKMEEWLTRRHNSVHEME